MLMEFVVQRGFFCFVIFFLNNAFVKIVFVHDWA